MKLGKGWNKNSASFLVFITRIYMYKLKNKKKKKRIEYLKSKNNTIKIWKF